MSGAAAESVEPQGLAAALQRFVEDQRSRGGLDFVELEARPGPGGLAVAGRVLTERQARDVRNLARDHGALAEIRVVADPASGLEEGWVVPTVTVLDLWREPGRAGEEMGRQTQYLTADWDEPLRLLGRSDDFVLLQGPDLAIGWARAKEVREAGAAQSRAAWDAVPRALPGVARPPAVPGVTAASVVARARAYLGLPYVWGGTGAVGVDCSGLVQRAFDPTGVVLPRHSGEQRRVGARVTDADVLAGDLLFATPRERKIGHVLLMTGPDSVIHACRTEHKVIEESLAENALRYAHQGWRRPVELAQ